jgi:hypothetical protein
MVNPSFNVIGPKLIPLNPAAITWLVVITLLFNRMPLTVGLFSVVDANMPPVTVPVKVPANVALLIVGVFNTGDANVPPVAVPVNVPDNAAPLMVGVFNVGEENVPAVTAGAVSVVDANVPPVRVPDNIALLITGLVRVLFVSV